MPKDPVNWEPDVKKGMEIQESMKEINEKLKADADRRKIDGFNLGDIVNEK